MKVYGLYDGKRTVCEVEVDTPSWLPVKPRIRREWLRLFVETSIRRYFQQEAPVVKV